MKLTKRVLYNQARPLDFQYPVKNQLLVNQMFDLMFKNHGIGLAAPQCGLSRRVFVMCVDQVKRACFNPEILEKSRNSDYYDEGCLSFIGESCKILRPTDITVRYFDCDGNEIVAQLSGLEARCFQHELDHLDGITMHDRYKEQNATKPGN
jgi:peptide deformylase